MKLGTCLPAVLLLSALLLLAAPASAQVTPGLVRVPVTLQAGPDIGFPAVDRIPRGSEVFVHGCLRDSSWCDVSFGGSRGWIEADTLEYFYDGRYVYLPDYIYRIDVPIVTFGFSAYWGNYYFGRPWFHRYAYWHRYWRTHPMATTQAPPQMQGAVAGRPAPATMPAAGTVASAPQQAAVPPAQGAGARPQGMMAAQAPTAVVPHGGTVGLAAMPHATQPGMARVGGGPSAALHAQMAGMAHAPVGGMFHAAAAGGHGMQFGGGGHGGMGHRH